MVGLIGFLASEGGATAAEGAEHAASAFNWFAHYAWLIPLLPFVSAGLILAFGKRTPGKGSAFGIAAVFVAFLFSLGVLWNFVQGTTGEYETNLAWFDIGPLELQLGILVDGLTAVMLVVVTSVSLMVQVYSLGYMKGDVRYTWFYFVLSMFTAAMLVVVVSSNVIQLLIGWEIMGLCSYLLIGHWYEDRVNSNAGIKAFITTRIGDVPMMFGFFALIAATGFVTTNINETTEVIAQGEVSTAFVAAAALLLFGGAIGKSAQFPLHVWLPDAMAGPTPVSALIHAATMVAAGVYLVGRLFEVFIVADPFVLTIVAIVAAITMLGAAVLAIAQDDIKRVLAYSTLSQLAYMVAGLGMGEEGYTAGVFHLFTHAFFKALLFLGAGSVIHAVHSNNMSDMGGLRKKMPITFATMLIGSLALAGIFPFSGFWSKDELLVVANDTQTTWLLVTFLLTAGLTAFYTTRMVLLTFYGEYQGHADPHESPPSMAWPLLILAVPATLAGLLFQVFGQWVYFEHPHEAVVHWPIIIASTVVAWTGIASGYSVYRRRTAEDPMQRRLGPVWGVLQERYYIDAFYMRWIVRPVRDTWSAWVYRFNQHVLDGIVNGAAALARGLSHVIMWFDRTVIDGSVNGAANVAEAGGGLLKYLQSGNVQWYAAGVIAGVIVLTAFFVRLT